MSRFFLTVVVPDQTPVDEIDLVVEELMAPYDALLEVSEAIRQREGCRCGLVHARRIAAELAAELVPTPAEPGAARRSSVITLLERHRVQDPAFEIQLRHELFSPRCLICKGTGRYPPGFHPTVKFDGALYGGLDVTAWIRGAPRLVAPGARSTLEDNLCPVRELLARHRSDDPGVDGGFSNSLLTPDGQWYQAPKSGYLADVAADAFDAEFARRLEAYEDGWAVGLECLI